MQEAPQLSRRQVPVLSANIGRLPWPAHGLALTQLGCLTQLVLLPTYLGLVKLNIALL